MGNKLETYSYITTSGKSFQSLPACCIFPTQTYPCCYIDCPLVSDMEWQAASVSPLRKWKVWNEGGSVLESTSTYLSQKMEWVCRSCCIIGSYHDRQSRSTVITLKKTGKLKKQEKFADSRIYSCKRWIVIVNTPLGRARAYFPATQALRRLTA